MNKKKNITLYLNILIIVLELISLFADVPPETTFRYVKKLSIFTL